MILYPQDIYDIIVNPQFQEVKSDLEAFLQGLGIMDYHDFLNGVHIFQNSNGYPVNNDAYNNFKVIINDITEEEVLTDATKRELRSFEDLENSKLAMTEAVEKALQDVTLKFQREHWEDFKEEYFFHFPFTTNNSLGISNTALSKRNAAGFSSNKFRRYNNWYQEKKRDKDLQLVVQNLQLLKNSMRQRNANSGKAPTV